MKVYISKMKRKLYELVVNRVPQINEEYMDYKNDNIASKYKSYLLLMKLNFAYYFLHIDLSNTTKKKIKLCNKESGSNQSIINIDEFIRILLQYDIVSFDIFDTLVFRPFGNPKDLFHFIGEKNNYLDFARIRGEIESKLRYEKMERQESSEISIYDIYDYMAKYLGIDNTKGIEYEIETELELCFSNPYMKKVYDTLRNSNKKIIFVSDMYLPKDYIKPMLHKCGYRVCEDMFISCEYGKSKHDGKLYDLVKEKYGKQLKYIHIGDNEYSDVRQAKSHGFDAIYYPNVNIIGSPYRSRDMSCIVGSAYKGIVNAQLHNGMNIFTSQYEYGYVYGGLFVLGYCNFINQYVIKNNIDKILFLSRDGDIIKQVYDIMYPNSNCEYVYWSRLAGTKLAANGFRYDYLKRFITHKINTNIKIKDVLKVMELEFMLDEIDLSGELLLTSKNSEILQDYIINHWEIVLHQYEPQSNAGKLYYSNVLEGCKKVCAVDVGWAGSGAVYLDYAVNKVWGLSCEVIGIIGGTNGKSSGEVDTSEALLQSGKLVSYLFSQGYNRVDWRFHNPSLNHNLYFEALLCSTNPSFKGFKICDTELGYELLFSNRQEYELNTVQEIQKGILDFISHYMAHFKKYPFMFNITGSDAYSPFKLAASQGEKFLENILKEFNMNPFVGDDGL